MKNKDIKIVFFDVDGTLIELGTNAMTPNTLKMLHSLQEQGIKICISSGRSPVQMPELPGGSFDAYITFTGSYCFGPEGVIYSNPISSADVQQILRNAQELGRPVVAATDKEMSPNGVDENLYQYYAFAGEDIKTDPNFAEVIKKPVYQIMVGCPENERQAIIKNTENARVAAWWDRACDVMPANGDKGKGIELVLKHFGLDRSQAMAFGDGDNDLEMFHAVDHPVAMGNGSDNLKKIAEAVCGRVDEDGIYHYMVEKGIIAP